MWGYKDETVCLNIDLKDLEKMARLQGKDWCVTFTKVIPPVECDDKDDTVVTIKFTRTVNHRI